MSDLIEPWIEPCEDVVSRQAAIDTLGVGAELLRRVLDDTDIVGIERKKYEWGLGLIESYIADIKALPSAQPGITPCLECKWFFRDMGCGINYILS